MKRGRKIQSTGVENARKALPSILDAAAAGHVTIITRRGTAVAAVVPPRAIAMPKPASLRALAGTGKGLWGRAPGTTVSRLRDEWSR